MDDSSQSQSKQGQYQCASNDDEPYYCLSVSTFKYEKETSCHTCTGPK